MNDWLAELERYAALRFPLQFAPCNVLRLLKAYRAWQ